MNLNPKDYEICDRGQDGIQFHTMINFYEGRVCLITGYDHEGPNKNAFWEPACFESAFIRKVA